MAILPEGLKIHMGEKKMRKLRDDITLKEAWEWVVESNGRDKGKSLSDKYWQLTSDIMQWGMKYKAINKYPDSFYEALPIGSFGKFWDVHSTTDCMYGYLIGTDDGKYRCGYLSHWFSYFTPGLPQDVDKEGTPI